MAKELALNDAEFRLWELYLALYDWDKKHTETYLTVEATDRQISEVLMWSAPKVCRTRNQLLAKRLISQIKTSVVKVLLIPHKDIEFASLQEKVAEMKYHNSQVKQKIAPVKRLSGSFNQNSLVSYKDKYRFIKDNKQYQEIESLTNELGDYIGDRWFEEETREVVNEHQRLAGLMLEYEIENNLLPI